MINILKQITSSFRSSLSAGEGGGRGLTSSFPLGRLGWAFVFSCFCIFASAQNCDHTDITPKEENGKMVFVCKTCGKIDYTKWTQKQDFGATIADPFLNMDADLHDLGEQMAFVTTSSPIVQAWLLRDNDGKLLGYIDQSSKPNPMVQFSLPPRNSYCPVTVVMQLKKTEAVNGDNNQMQMKETTPYAVAHFTYKPFHRVRSMEVTEVANKDSVDIMHPYNVIRFSIDAPKDEDVMEADHFVLYRAKSPDFKDKQAIASYNIDGYKDIKKEKDEEVGWFEVVDKDLDCTYNELMPRDSVIQAVTEGAEALVDNQKFSDLDKNILTGFYTHPSQPIYYRVERAVVASLWPSHDGTYCVSDSVNASSQLASASRVKVIQDPYWGANKKVTLQVQMDNPHPWDYNQLEDAPTIHSELADSPLAYRRYMWDKGAQIRVLRYSPEKEWEQGVDLAAKEYVITGDKVQWVDSLGCYIAEVGDCQSLPYVHYYYKAIVEQNSSVYPLAHNNSEGLSSDTDAEKSWSTIAALIQDFTASKGEYPGKVVLKWNLGVGSVDKVSIMRREWSMNKHGEWTALSSLNPKQTEYLDETALSGHAYEYKLTTSTNYRLQVLEDSATVMGWGSYRSYISGYITMPNGTAMAHQLVKIERKDYVFIDDVLDEKGNVIMVGYHDGIITDAKPAPTLNSSISNSSTFNSSSLTPDIVDGDIRYSASVYTDERGYFEFSDLPFLGDGTTYRVSFERLFDHNGMQVASYDYKISDGMPYFEGEKYICAEVAKFSGNVKYTDSTVPVGGAHFVLYNVNQQGETLSSYTLRDSHGDAVESDAKGEFSFTIPAGVTTRIQVVKDNHKFENNGFIKVNGKDIFTPTAEDSPYAGYFLNDSTRVRLVGRLSGGNVQARKQLGFGDSKNNLGDDLTIELQLEGDNTSWIVYHQDDPDNTTIHTVVPHHVSDQSTDVTYEKKRIVIKPDVKTGEFFVDLIPTKYRVTQLLATGYATFYQKGEGLDVLDLNDSTQVHTIANVRDGNDTYQRNASYVRTYHVPATLTYEQYRYGLKTPFLGEESIKNYNLINEEVTHTLVSKTSGPQSSNLKPQYTFGYPVFISDHNYILEAYAHEDFYYNNDPMHTLDEVPLDSGIIHVQNGLLDNKAHADYRLNSNGRCNFAFTVGNPTFALLGDAALRSMNVSVELNDYYYEAEPLRAFVTGHRKVATDTMPIATIGSGITVVDVLRDPPGSTSYSYRDAGTTYNWSKDITNLIKTDLKISLGVGPAFKFNMGTGWMLEAHTGVLELKGQVVGEVNIPILRENDNTKGQYSMTLSERVQTSSDPLDVGAMSDVYIGTVDVLNFYRTQSFNVIDETTYNMIKQGIDKGAIKVVSSGTDADGKKHYMVISDIVSIQDGCERSFIYSQKHIVGTIIPEIERQIETLLVDGDESTLRTLANKYGKTYYLRSSTEEQGYIYICPDNAPDGTKDEVAELMAARKDWMNVVKDNEKTKLDLSKNPNNIIRQYSVSAGGDVDYSEQASGYYTTSHWTGDKTVTGGFTFNPGGGGDSGDIDKDEDGKPVHKPEKRELTAAGVSISFSIGASDTSTKTANVDFSRTKSKGYGFHMATNDNGYMSVDVYGEKMNIKDLELTDEQLKWIEDGRGNGDAYRDSSAVHNYVFFLRGGAARNPWYPQDYTLYYKDGNGKSLPLGENLLKIDNPRIYVDHPIVNNQPEDEEAEFRVRITNDTEVNAATQYLNPSQFVFYVDDSSNPNGASITMDGLSLAATKNFILAPGATIEKTIKVARGTGYDFDDLRLVFRDAGNSLYDTISVSVHYLPVASKVNISAPENKWTMNTLSPYDVVNKKNRYYIPVTIDGFNVNSDGFHHIELQYKKKTDGESKWTNVCGFYADSTYYRQATGQREMIPASGKITNVKFYGENDPIEMQYDLRAVAFRKLGTGFVTRSSDVIGGIKDTRCPSVFGTPSPANGILTYADVITIPFNEPIAYNYLDKIANFRVTGFTNSSDNTYATALSFPKPIDSSPVPVPTPGAVHGDVEDVPMSKVTRNLSGNDFTLDAMVKGKGIADMYEIFSLYNDDALRASEDGETHLIHDYLSFFVEDRKLGLCQDGYVWYSKDIPDNVNLADNLVRLGITYTQPENTEEGANQVNFYVNGVNIGVSKVVMQANETDQTQNIRQKCTAYGRIRIGRYFVGTMTDLRLWNRALPEHEIAQKVKSRVSGGELGLVAYWPLNEGKGTTAFDDINGANLYFTSQSWQSTTKQYSLALSGQQLQLRNVEKIERAQSYDYTLSLWARADKLDADSVDVFSCGEWNGKQFLRIGTNKEEYLVVQSKNDEIGLHEHAIVPKAKFSDGDWHNIILVANKSKNSGAIYYDGSMVSTFNGNELGGLASTNVRLGHEKFYGCLDNITIWDHTFPTNSVLSLYNRCASGYEMGLMLNLPFEENHLGSDNQYTTIFSAKNIVHKIESRNENGDYPPCDTVFAASVINDKAMMERLADEYRYCPLEPLAGIKNLEFDWSATDNGLQINLLQNDADINHQNISVVVRGVEDLAGNSLQNPQRLILYVDKNVLKWKLKRVSIEKPYLEPKSFTIKFGNESGRQLSYDLYEYCSWLSLDKTSGYIDPLDEQEVKVTLDEGLAPGEYNTSISLRDEDGLVSQLPIALTVTATAPEWEVTTDSEYNQQMNITGQVWLKNEAGSDYIDVDKRDIVYAFYDGVCLGKANITVEDNSAYVYLTVKGKPSMNAGDDSFAALINFRLWRAATGNVTYLKRRVDGKFKEVEFAKNSNLGTHSDPVILCENGAAVQTLNLKKGWNWVSFYLEPNNTEGVNGLFESTAPFSVGDMFSKFEGQTPSFMQSDGRWSAGMDATAISIGNVYQLWTQKDCDVRVLGRTYKEDDRVVTLKNTGWNDLAYLCNTDKPLALALADYMQGDKAVDGTVIMSRNLFAQVDKGKWYGSLSYMQPGQGYYIYHKGAPGVQIHYYDDSREKSSKAKAAGALSLNDDDDENVSQISGGSHKSAMPVVAEIIGNGDYTDDDQLVAYADGEEVGRAKMQVLDDGRKRYFIMLSAEPGQRISWVQERMGQSIAKAKSNVQYHGMTVVGSINAPLAIDFLSGLDSSDDVKYYTVDGVQVAGSTKTHRILISNDGEKVVGK